MSKVTIEINIDNDAFGDTPEIELSSIFKRLASTAHTPLAEMLSDAATHPQSILDVNGNTVGSLSIELDEE